MRVASALAAAGLVALFAGSGLAQAGPEAGQQLRDLRGTWLPDAVVARFIDDDRFIVLSGATDLLLYDRTTEAPRRLGGRGRGPGEFQLLSSIGASRDGRVYALDASSGTVAQFNADGTLRSSRRLSPGSLCCSSSGFALRREGAAPGSVQRYQTVRYSVQALEPPQAPSVEVSWDIAERAPMHLSRSSASDGGFAFGRPIPWPWVPRPMLVLAADRAYFGTGRDAKMGTIDYTTGRVVEESLALHPLSRSAATRRALRNRFFEDLADPALRRQYDGLVPLDSVPATAPAYDQMLPAVAEGVWIRSDSGRPARATWRLFVAGKGFTSGCTLPVVLRVLAFGTSVLVATREDVATGEILVELYRMERICSDES